MALITDAQELLARSIMRHQARYSDTNKRMELLTDGQGNLQPANVMDPHEVYVRSSQNQNDLEIAILDPNANIPLFNAAAYANYEVEVVNPPNSSRRMVRGLTYAGLSAQPNNGQTPLEQYLANITYPSQDRLAMMRPYASTPPDKNIWVNPPWGYVLTATGKAGVQATALSFDLTSTIAALTSGQHQLGLVCFDPVNDVLTLTTNTAFTSTGTLPNRVAFGPTDIAALTPPTGQYPAGLIYLYFGQAALTDEVTATPGDIYRSYDPRLIVHYLPFYQLIQAGGTGQTQRRTLDLIGSASISIAVVDNAGQDRTEITFAALTGAGSPLTTKGDLYTFSTVNTRLGVQADRTLLIADSSQTTGLRWGNNPILNAANIDNSPIGATTPSTGAFSLLTVSPAATDTNPVTVSPTLTTSTVDVEAIYSAPVFIPSNSARSVYNAYLTPTIGGTTSTGLLQLYGMRIVPSSGANYTGAISYYFGLRLGPFSKSNAGASLANQYGLYVDNVNVGTTLNYAVFTNAGLNSFGDQVAIVGSADRIQLNVTANGTQSADLQDWNVLVSSTAYKSSFIDGTGLATLAAIDNQTAHVDLVTIGHYLTTANAGANNIGSGLVFKAADSASAIGAGVSVFQINAQLPNATDANRTGQADLFTFDSTGARLILHMAATGTRGIASVLAGTQGTNRAALGGSLFDHFADAGNTTTTETDLYSDSVAGNTLVTTGDYIDATYTGTTVPSGTATRQLRVYFAGTVIFNSAAFGTTSAAPWKISVQIIMDSGTSVRYIVVMSYEVGSANGIVLVQQGALTGLTLTGANILKITGQAAGTGAATNDIVAKFGKVFWQSAV